jgi:hypothetical protein
VTLEHSQNIKGGVCSQKVLKPHSALTSFTMKLALTPLAFAASVSAHAIFQQLYVNGKTPGHTVAIRAPNYEGVSAATA